MTTIWNELYSFFSLYIDEDYVFSRFGSGWLLLLMLLILYANAGLYLADFYRLVKRKSRGETLAIMILPCLISVEGAALLLLLVHVPEPGMLSEFSHALRSNSLNVGLMLCAVIYVLFWIVSYFLQRNRIRSEVRRWVISCIPDYCFVGMIVVIFLWHLIAGQSPFFMLPEWILWVYLYAIYLLGCKIVLLASGVLVLMYSTRITIFKWKEWMNPTAFLIPYFTVFQNCVFRNAFLYAVGTASLLTLPFLGDSGSDFYETVKILGTIYICVGIVVLLSLTHVTKLFGKFRTWGEHRKIKEMFCREYFLEEPIHKSKQFTVTRHFLIDEQRPAVVYYWPRLQSVGGWHMDKKGRNRTLYFEGKEFFQVSGEEEEASQQVFAYAKKQMFIKANSFKDSEAAKPQENASTNDTLTKIVMAVAIILFFLIYTWWGR